MRVTVASLAVIAAAAMTAPAAEAYTKKVKDACAGDYQNFCSQYVPDSAQVRRCFESNRKSLTRYCINALVDAGEVPAKYLKK